MDLLSPWFLAGGLAVGLPLWLHLMRRRNPVRLQFSSLMFFRQRTETTVRERRLRYLLLLALRLALLLLLALAFAKPIWERPPVAVGSDLPRLHIVVLDTSMSMGYGNRWEEARSEAARVIDSMGQSDRAQVVANGPSVRVLTAATADRTELRRVIESLVPGEARNNYGDAIEAVRNLAAGDPAPVSVHLISDLQASSMPSRFQDLVLPERAELELHPIGGSEEANWAIDSVKGATRLHGEQNPQLEVTVASFAAEPAAKTVSLWIDGRVAGSQRQTVPAAGRAAYAFELAGAPQGFSRAEFRLEPTDDLRADDVRRVALDNTEPEPILFVSAAERRRDLLYYQTALEASASSSYRVEAATPAQTRRLDPGRYALVVLSDAVEIDTGFASRLRTWVEAGGAALVAVGPRSALARRTALTGHRVEQALSSERGGAPFSVAGAADNSHPVVAAAEGLRPVKFMLHLRVEPAAGDSVPLRLGNGDPLLVEHELGRGRVLVFASSLDNVWNDLPLNPVFVPFVAETARYRAGGDAVRHEAVLGDLLELGRRRGTGDSVQVADPAGERVLTLSDSVSRESIALESLGFYQISAEGRSELVAVNPDPRESDLRRIESDTLELWESTGSAGGQPAAEGLGPVEAPPWRLWRLALLLLLLAVLLESLVSHRHLDAVRGD